MARHIVNPNTRFVRLLKNRRARRIISILVVVATIVAFGYYIATHPDTLRVLTRLNLPSLFALTFFYLLTVVANAIVLSASLRLIGKPVPYLENVLLTGYSSIINFFGPLQSGPGFRALYLKQRHGVSLRSFTAYTLLFYAVFAGINGLVIVGAVAYRFGVSPGAFAILLAIIGCIGVASVFARRKVRTVWHKIGFSSAPKSLSLMWIVVSGALLLSLATAGAYFIELHTVNSSLSPFQAVIYTAAANLALFVSLTPGAIGFRESFLLLSQRLHDIPTQVIVQASLIDRAFYVCFLGVLFLVVIAVSAKTGLFRRDVR